MTLAYFGFRYMLFNSCFLHILDIYFFPLYKFFNLGDEAPVFVPKFQPDLCRKILSVHGNTT